MKRVLILCIFGALTSRAGLCDVTYFPPLQPIGSGNQVEQVDQIQTYNADQQNFVTPPNSYTYQTQNIYQNIPAKALSRLESQMFNQSFNTYNPQNRIERLEQKMFGAVQTGDLNTRYRALQMAARNYRQANIPTQIAQNSGGGVLKTILGGLGNSMVGSMTGFTPPISPYYDPYSCNGGYNTFNMINPNPYGMYRGYRSNTGYYDRYRNFDTGAGVHILD